MPKIYTWSLLLVLLPDSAFAQQTGLSSARQNREPVHGKSVVYIVHHGVIGSLATTHITCDSIPIGAVQGQKYIYAVLDPGNHVFMARSGTGVFKWQITLQPGNVYYIRQTTSMGFIRSKVKLELMGEEESGKWVSRGSATVNNKIANKPGGSDIYTVNNYDSIFYEGEKIRLPLDGGGKYLRIYSQRVGRNNYYLYFRNDSLMEKKKHESRAAFRRRFFEGYPLLAQMVHDKEIDELTGIERQIVFREYDRWIDAPDDQKKDTSMTLKGILDANRCPVPKKIFWHNYWVTRFMGLAGIVIYRRKLDPKETDIVIHNKELANNEEYSKAYKARSLTRFHDKMVLARMLGALAPPFLTIL